MCVNFFSVKDFTGTTLPRILKFGRNIEYDSLYFVIENQLPNDYHSIYLPVFVAPVLARRCDIGMP